MKAITDLNALIPKIVELLKNNQHEIGESYFERGEDDWGRSEEATPNYVSFEEDGWLIEVSYQCCGEWENDPGDYWTPPSSTLLRAWGEVTDITAYHYDEDSDEYSVFENENLNQLWSALDEELKDIA